MSIIFSSWLGAFASFYLAALACGTLNRQGFLPLHISSVMAVGAYAFAAANHCMQSMAASLLIATSAAILFSVMSGLAFLKTRAATAALTSIAIQFITDQYVRTTDWTGGSQGMWEGIPILAIPDKMALTLFIVSTGVIAYEFFQRSPASKLLIVHGQAPILSHSLGIRTWPQMAFANTIVGLLSGLAGVLLALEIGFISPKIFSLHWSLLYASVVLFVGYTRQTMIAAGSLIFSTLPEALRLIGLGDISASAWRGMIVGALVLIIVILQAPRPASYGSSANDNANR